MTETTFQIAQAAQQRVPGGLIAFFGIDDEAEELTALFRYVTAGGKHRVSISVGSHAELPGLGTLEVIDLRLAEHAGTSQVLARLTPYDAAHTP